MCLCTGRGLETSWSPVQGVLPTVLGLVTELKRKVSCRRPRPELGCSAKGGGGTGLRRIWRSHYVRSLCVCVCVWKLQTNLLFFFTRKSTNITKNVHLEKLNCAAGQKFIFFHEIGKFITVFARDRHWILSIARSMQSTSLSYFFKNRLSSILSSTHWSARYD
jgi:hypothetical protein